MTSNRRERPGWQPLPTRHTAPIPVRDALDTLASTMGLSSVDHINRLFTQWSSIVGDQLASKCEPKRLQDGVLTVVAFDQQWAVELKWMTSLIVERCANVLDNDSVSQVRITR